MENRTYQWHDGDADHAAHMVWVPATGKTPYSFGGETLHIPVHVSGFFMLTTPVTQALWTHVMGVNPSRRREADAPVENVSWNAVTEANGFLARLNVSAMREQMAGAADCELRFRLPSETEWEYAARGGPHWREDFMFSGSNRVRDVAWCGPRWTRVHDFVCKVLGWRRVGQRRYTLGGLTRTHAVAGKAPNQLGLYDLSGNVWEWCQDVCTDELALIPRDGTAFEGVGDERRLRGGCHSNWDLHCTIAWRYGIVPAWHDGDIGFRIVLAF